MTVTDVGLVRPDDPDYCRWARDQKASSSKGTGRPPCPFARDYHRALSRWEFVVRHILGSALGVFPQRILAWKETGGHGRVRSRYRELDYVRGVPDNPSLVVEIKQRERLGRRSGASQVWAALEVSQSRWPELSGACVNVHMGPVLGLAPAEDYGPFEVPDFVSPEDLGEALLSGTASFTGSLPLFWMDSRAVTDYGLAEKILTPYEVEHLPQLRELANNPLGTLDSTSGSGSQGQPPPLGPSLGDLWPQ
jgi:hypothetical protein